MLRLKIDIPQESLDLAAKINDRKDSLKACMFMLDESNTKLIPDPDRNVYN